MEAGRSGLVVTIVPVAIALAVYLGRINELPIGGDEPHYLIMADAVADLELDLQNSYQRDFQHPRIFGPVEPHAYKVSRGWMPYHAPGLAILLAVPFSLGGPSGAKTALCLLAGLLPWSLFGWFRASLPGSVATWLALGLTLCLPFCFGAAQIYPDLPAGVIAVTLMLWLCRRTVEDATPGAWAGFWITVGLLPWLNVKFIVTTAVFAVGGMGFVWRARRAGRQETARIALATAALVAIGPFALVAFHLWAFGTPFGVRGPSELTTSPSRALMMFLGLHLDQSQGMWFQHPMLLAGLPALPLFARTRPRLALFWLALYGSLIVPNAFELTRFGGGGPSGRFGWSAAWLWSLPIAVALEQRPELGRLVRPVAMVSLLYQALLTLRWWPTPLALFPVLDERLPVRDSLFPVAVRYALPSYYFWDFLSYLWYLPNVVAICGVGLLLAIGALTAVRMGRVAHLLAPGEEAS